LHPSRRRETSSSVTPRLQPCEERTEKEKSTRSSKIIPGRTFFSRLTSPEQSYAAAPRQDTQHQQPQAPQTYERSWGTHRWKPLPSNDREDVTVDTDVCVCVCVCVCVIVISKLQSVSKCVINPVTNSKPVYNHSIHGAVCFLRLCFDR
jgi:hypothetical protein